MLVIRLFRVGKRNQPFFRIVVIDKKAPPRGGRPLEILGFYNPITKERAFKKDRIQYWMSVGAKPSDTVHNLLVKEGILKGEKIAVHKKKKPSSVKTTEGREKKVEEAPKPASAEAMAGKEEKPEPEKPKKTEEAEKS